MAKQNNTQTEIMRRFSTLAGPFRKLPAHTQYRVQFESVMIADKRMYRYWARFIAYGTLLLVIGFAVILFNSKHWVALSGASPKTEIENWIMLFCLILLQLFLIIGTYSSTRASLKAKNPVPVRPPKHLRVAFATTRAPGEPVNMVETTLKAMKNVYYKVGTIDVWLLDETNDRALKRICAELQVNYFSRAGIAEWNTTRTPHVLYKWAANRMKWSVNSKKNTPKINDISASNPYFAARSKHGNFNSWRKHLTNVTISYDILAGVDTDHIPEPNYLDRLLGYFRDKDVAYVVGPQVYGNYGASLNGLVARWAESQASFFQSTIQRAANDSDSAMFVGTNYAVRMNVLDQISGFQPCITEDMATGLTIHVQKNPQTGNRWRSVYTPDVLAIGEGPSLWGPYFTQQWRWAAGAFDTWHRKVWRVFPKLSVRAKIHYLLVLLFYPLVAFTWLLGIISSMTYLLTGATAVIAPWGQFVSLYMMSVVMQFSLYFWNRRYNVSPHEPQGSFGIPGIILTTIAAPIYLSALVGVIFSKKAHFVVTTKGDSNTFDNLLTFRIHMQWAVVLIGGIIYGFRHNHHHPAMLVWVLFQLGVCILPIVLAMSITIPAKLRTVNLFKQKLTEAGESSNAAQI